MEKNQSRGVALQVPTDLMDRIRALQKGMATKLGLRTKAPQYMIIAEAITLLEKREAK